MVKLFAVVGAQENNIEKIIPAITNEKIFLITTPYFPVLKRLAHSGVYLNASGVATIVSSQ